MAVNPTNDAAPTTGAPSNKGRGERRERRDDREKEKSPYTERTLRRITVPDGIAAEKMFELLMGSEVAPRKEFIATAEIDREQIDA
jgi:DNA gyrase/topoisomerase IV subunit B